MTEESKMVLRGDKCADIIQCISAMFNVSLELAADIFYNSDTSVLIEEGVADLHCRSSRYLAQCVWDEYKETQ
ncbi:MAG: DUF3791 domain-containing protein, partial [Muribaculaceae bacterium]|nr:DUF3791 domain-containing protein [Muribaculaceae bacterium]